MHGKVCVCMYVYVCVCLCMYVYIYIHKHTYIWLLRWLSSKESTCQCRRCKTQLPSLSWENPLEKEMAICSSILVGKIPWTEEPGRLHSWGCRAGHSWATEHKHRSSVYIKTRQSQKLGLASV